MSPKLWLSELSVEPGACVKSQSIRWAEARKRQRANPILHPSSITIILQGYVRLSLTQTLVTSPSLSASYLTPKLFWDYMDTSGYLRRPCRWVWGSTTLSFRCDGSGGIPASVMMGSRPSHIFCLRGRSGEGKGEERSWK